MQERVSRRRQSKRDKTRRLERGNERRSSVPIRVDLSGQPPSTYTDRASAQWTRTAQILSVAPVSSHQDDSRTRSGGLRNVQSGSVWAARDRQRAVCVLSLAARPRFYEIIRGPEVLRDHPRSSEVVYELHLAKKSRSSEIIRGRLRAPLGEEVVPLVVHDNEGGEVDHVDLPHRFHPQLGILEHLLLLDCVLGEDRGRASD